LAPIEPASCVPPEPLQADGLNEARNEATEAIAARGRERGFVPLGPRSYVERDRRGHSFRRDRADRFVGDAFHLDSRDGIAHEYLSRSRVVGDSRRHVDRSAEVVAVLEDHRARVDPEASRRETKPCCLLHQLKAAQHAD
jgi:hypothetical protein